MPCSRSAESLVGSIIIEVVSSGSSSSTMWPFETVAEAGRFTFEEDCCNGCSGCNKLKVCPFRLPVR